MPVFFKQQRYTINGTSFNYIHMYMYTILIFFKLSDVEHEIQQFGKWTCSIYLFVCSKLDVF